MNTAWFDRLHGRRLDRLNRDEPVAVAERDARLAALWEAAECLVKEGVTPEVADGTAPVMQALAKAGEELAASPSPAPMPGYGQIFYNEGQAWYVGGDGDGDGFGKLVQGTLEKIDGVQSVKYEAESFPPKADGWVKAYPRRVEEAASALNTFSTRGSVGIPIHVVAMGSKFFVAYTSGALVDYVAYGTRDEAMRAARRLAAEEGVEVKEGARERVEEIVRNYPQWSPAERRKMDQLIAEVMDHVINGTGNAFIKGWVDRNIPPSLLGG